MGNLTDEEKTTSDALPFSVNRQEAVLGYVLTRESFFLQCKDRIEPRWFNDPVLALVYEAQLLWYHQYKKFPNWADVLEHPRVRGETQQRRNLIFGVLERCVGVRLQEHAIEPIMAELTEWLHARRYMERVYSSRDMFNRGQFKESYLEIDKLSREIHEITFAEDKVYRFNDPGAILAKRYENVQGALTWGLSVFDKLLLPEAGGNGCLLKGTTTTIVAPVNCGKTTLMTTVAVANMARGKKVLYVPHEGSIDELRVKILCCMMDKDIEWLNHYLSPVSCGGLDLLHKKDPTQEEQKIVGRVVRFIEILEKYLTFMPMIHPGLFVEDVVAAIRRKQEEAVNIDGRGYDLVVDDYPAKLTTKEAAGGKLEHRHKMDIIYASLNLLAEEVGFAMLNAAQTNRDGVKINGGYRGSEHRLLEMTDIGESLGPLQDIATVITANRSPLDEAQNRISLHNAKSRTGTRGWTVVCRSNYAHGITHGEQLGATWYRGGAIGTERMEQLLGLYKNEQIPFDVEI